MNRDDGRTPLMSVVLTGDFGYDAQDWTESKWDRRRIAKNLIERCPDMLTNKDCRGRSCLHIAADGDQVRMLEWLLTQICDRLGKDAARELLLHAATEQSMTVLHTASVKKGSAVVTFLTSTASYVRLGFAEDEAAEFCKKLLRCRAFNERTCLHLAAGVGRKSIVSRILEACKEHGIDDLVRAVTESDGRTAAHSAANWAPGSLHSGRGPFVTLPNLRIWNGKH